MSPRHRTRWWSPYHSRKQQRSRHQAAMSIPRMYMATIPMGQVSVKPIDFHLQSCLRQWLSCQWRVLSMPYLESCGRAFSRHISKLQPAGYRITSCRVPTACYPWRCLYLDQRYQTWKSFNDSTCCDDPRWKRKSGRVFYVCGLLRSIERSMIANLK